MEKSKARKAGGHRCKRISAVGRQEDGEKCGNDALSSHCSRQLYPITPVPPPPYRPDRVCARGPASYVAVGRAILDPRLRISPSLIYSSFLPPIISPYLSPPANFPISPRSFAYFFITAPFLGTRSIAVPSVVSPRNGIIARVKISRGGARRESLP